MEKSKDPNSWKNIPVPNLCEWQVLKKIWKSKDDLTQYKLARYATKFDECTCIRTSDYWIRKLVKKWEKYNLIELIRPFNGTDIRLVKITSHGIEYANRVSSFFDSYTS